jgi:hypothetical protein
LPSFRVWEVWVGKDWRRFQGLVAVNEFVQWLRRGVGKLLLAASSVLHVRGVGQQLLLREPLPHQHLAGYTKRYQVKRRLAKIDANRNYLHIDDPPY